MNAAEVNTHAEVLKLLYNNLNGPVYSRDIMIDDQFLTKSGNLKTNVLTISGVVGVLSTETYIKTKYNRVLNQEHHYSDHLSYTCVKDTVGFRTHNIVRHGDLIEDRRNTKTAQFSKVPDTWKDSDNIRLRELYTLYHQKNAFHIHMHSEFLLSGRGEYSSLQKVLALQECEYDIFTAIRDNLVKYGDGYVSIFFPQSVDINIAPNHKMVPFSPNNPNPYCTTYGNSLFIHRSLLSAPILTNYDGFLDLVGETTGTKYYSKEIYIISGSIGFVSCHYTDPTYIYTIHHLFDLFPQLNTLYVLGDFNQYINVLRDIFRDFDVTLLGGGTIDHIIELKRPTGTQGTLNRGAENRSVNAGIKNSRNLYLKKKKRKIPKSKKRKRKIPKSKKKKSRKKKVTFKRL